MSLHLNVPEQSRTLGEIRAHLYSKYGFFMTPPEVASVLRLGSTDALRMARKRGKVPLQPVRNGGRTQMFATDQVAQLLQRWLDTDVKEATM